MHLPKPGAASLALLTAAAIAIPLALPAPAATTGTLRRTPGTSESAQVVLDWERTAFATIYPAPPPVGTAIPVGVPVLGFTSAAMYDAATSSMKRHHSSETAAVATAAHDVLLHYYPAAETALATQLDTSLAAVPDGVAEETGVRVGKRAAQRLIRSRKHDGYLNPDIHYTLLPGVGIWQPVPPATDMLAAWIGSLRPLVVHRLARVDGPDRLTSDDYTADFNEVKLLGSSSSTARSQAQTDTAVFFDSNSATLVGDALIRYLETHPQDLDDTARLFASIHGAMTDSLITCWRLKRDVGFWRPFQAIQRAAEDGNPDTEPEAGWTALRPQPPYSDYVSGHGCLTGPAVEVVRRTLGETTQLELRSSTFPTAPRTYPTLTQLEHDAFNARIWGGFHFRDAMADAYAIGHRTARKVMESLD